LSLVDMPCRLIRKCLSFVHRICTARRTVAKNVKIIGNKLFTNNRPPPTERFWRKRFNNVRRNNNRKHYCLYYCVQKSRKHYRGWQIGKDIAKILPTTLRSVGGGGGGGNGTRAPAEDMVDTAWDVSRGRSLQRSAVT